MILLAGCNFAQLPQGDASPTVEIIPITVEVTPTGEPTLTPSATLTPEVVIASATPSPIPGPPTLPPTRTPTPGPYEHTIRQGETLIAIVQQYGYTEFINIIQEVVRLNDNVLNADALPGEGAVILIPRQTATPTPEGLELTPTSQFEVALAPTNELGLSVDTTLMQHQVVEGQTIVDIASIYDTTLEVLSRLNPDIIFAGCNFSIPSGGPNCNPLLQVGQAVNVPAPTPTPTLSPTPSGNETATPTPTYPAPMVVSPPQDAIVPPGSLRLEWVSVGVLENNQVYLIQIEDTTSGTGLDSITRETSFVIPDNLVPADGQVHVFNWRVGVAAPNEAGIYRIVSGVPEIRRFRWQSR